MFILIDRRHEHELNCYILLLHAVIFLVERVVLLGGGMSPPLCNGRGNAAKIIKITFECNIFKLFYETFTCIS